MKYGVHGLSEIYLVDDQNELIGEEIHIKTFEEFYNRDYSGACYWEIEIITPIYDFDLYDFLIRKNFNIYTKTQVKTFETGQGKNIWQKYSDAIVGQIHQLQDIDGGPAQFKITFYANDKTIAIEDFLPLTLIKKIESQD